ncbi:glycosyltransferase family 2 protein [Haloarcula sp. H-GB5]
MKYSTVNLDEIDLDVRSTGGTPEISVVIPTIPKSSHKRVVEDLKSQHFEADYEIIVVNDSSINACQARNAGLLTADSPIVAFTDDDCRIPSDWLQKISNSFDDNTICVEGSVSGGINYEGERGYLTCNLAVDRQSAISAGGFNSEFSGWREDTEFGWRMERDVSGECKYNEGTHVVHPKASRSDYEHDKEVRLRHRFPERYDSVMNSSYTDILYRKLKRLGVVDLINLFRHGGRH